MTTNKFAFIACIACIDCIVLLNFVLYGLIKKDKILNFPIKSHTNKDLSFPSNININKKVRKNIAV